MALIISFAISWERLAKSVLKVHDSGIHLLGIFVDPLETFDVVAPVKKMVSLISFNTSARMQPPRVVVDVVVIDF